MSFDLKEKVAVVTGGLGGIGLEIVKLLLAKNIKVTQKLIRKYRLFNQNFRE